MLAQLIPMWVAILLGVIFIVAAIVSSVAAYHNGITDGYGYSKEPNCPGYAEAGKYLRKTMSHRWHELNERPKGRIIPPRGGSATVRGSSE